MSLSTSSFESNVRTRGLGLTRPTWVLLACAILLCVFTEAAARFGMGHISRIQRRIDDEGAAALRIRRAGGGPKQVLLVGNSLLLDGVDMGLLQAGLQGRFEPRRFVVESTNFYDWRYGLAQLFRRGMRPDTVFLCLNAPQLTTSAIRGDFSARFLFGVQDIWPVSRATGADMTVTSSYYVAHYSTFFAARSELRAVVMGALAPSFVAMWHDFVTVPAVIAPDRQMITVIEPRLRTVRELCAKYGAEFRVLVPPTSQPGDGAILRAGELAGVPVLRPVPSGSLSRDFYLADGFHLNEKGAAVFTKAIIREMLR